MTSLKEKIYQQRKRGKKKRKIDALHISEEIYNLLTIFNLLRGSSKFYNHNLRKTLKNKN